MNKTDYNIKVNRAIDAQMIWKNAPAPNRGELIRQFGNCLRQNKNELAKLVVQDSKK